MEFYFEQKRKSSNRIWKLQNVLVLLTYYEPWRFYIIFFDKKGTVMQIPVPKKKTVTSNSIKCCY